jgi:hypothetical protein
MSSRALRKPTTALKLGPALQRMRLGSRLLLMHTREGQCWFVVPGGPVSDGVADQIKAHPLVSGQCDGLWPGHDQTYRMVT